MSMKSTKIWLSLLLLNATFSVSRAEAAPVMNSPIMAKIPVGSSYQDYAVSDDTATLDGDKFEAERKKLGLTMTIMTHGDKRAPEIKRGYVTMFAAWAQTTLRVPLGWFAVEAKNNVVDSIVQSPGKTVRIVARMPIESVTFQREREAFVDLKKTVVAQTRQRLQAQKLKPGKIELVNVSDEVFDVRADEVKDANGKNWSYIEHFWQRARPAERDEWWAKYARGEALSSLPEPLAMSLLAPKASFDKYLGLFGLMVRDQGLNWTREERLTAEEFAARVPDSAKFVQMADEAVALLKAGDIKAFQARFPEADKDVGREAKQEYLQNISKVLKMLPPTPERTSITLVSDSDPETPLFRVSFARDFMLGKIPVYYIAAIERDGKSGKLSLLGVATASLAEIEYAQNIPKGESSQKLNEKARKNFAL